MSVLAKAKAMKGGAFRYKEEKISIIDVIEKDDLTIDVLTTEHDHNFTIGQLGRFVEGCKPVSADNSSANLKAREAMPPTVIDQQTEAFVNLMGDMAKVLKDDIAKIGEDKEYIPQAKARGNNVNSIINLMKVGITMQKKQA
jgi:hypothetical protein